MVGLEKKSLPEKEKNKSQELLFEKNRIPKFTEKEMKLEGLDRPLDSRFILEAKKILGNSLDGKECLSKHVFEEKCEQGEKRLILSDFELAVLKHHSPYFRALKEGIFLEGSSNTIQVNSADNLKILLDIFYPSERLTELREAPPNKLFALLQEANYYSLEQVSHKLSDILVDKLWDTLKSGDIEATQRLAELFNDYFQLETCDKDSLDKRCRKVIQKYLKKQGVNPEALGKAVQIIKESNLSELFPKLSITLIGCADPYLPLLNDLSIGKLKIHLTQKGFPLLAPFKDLEKLHIHIHNKDEDEGFEILSELENMGSLKELKMESYISSQAYIHFRNFKSLEKLSLLAIPDDGALSHLLSLENLKSLNLGRSHNVREISLLKSFKHLESLNLSWVYNVGGEWMSHLSQFKNLKELHLGNCYSDEELQELVHLKDLKHLSLSSPSDQSLEKLAKLTNLRILSLNISGKITNKGILHLKSLVNLETLYCNSLKKVDDEGYAFIGSLNRLKKLTLDYPNITGKGLSPLAHLEQLEELTLYGDKITGKKLPPLGKLKNLKSLTLRCENLTDEGLLQLLPLSHLTELCLSRSRLITDKGLEVVKNLNNLKSLTLFSLDGLTTLAPLEGSFLTHLHLENLDRLEDQGLSALGGLTELEDLCINNVNISDVSLQLIKNLKLNRLDLSFLDKITDEGLANLGNLTALRHLKITGCKLTDLAFLKELRFLHSFILESSGETTTEALNNQLDKYLPFLPHLEKAAVKYQEYMDG